MRFSLVALAAALALLALSAPAQAFTGEVTANEVKIVGDDTSDLLQIGSDSGLLTHSPAGAGYASKYDWNSSPAITQFVPNSAQLRVLVLGNGGDDAVRVGDATWPADGVPFPIIFRGGDGRDSYLVDQSWDTSNRFLDAGGDSTGTGVVLDGVEASWRGEGVEIFAVQLGGGNDTVRIGGASRAAPLTVDGGPGTDTARVGTAGGGLAALQGGFAFLGGTGDDSLSVDDAASTNGSVIDIDDGGLHKGYGIAQPAAGVEHLSFTAGSGNDSIAKSSGQAWSLNAAGGDDVVTTRDAVADSVACGAGGDFVVSDGLDALGGDCERSDRAPASGGSGPTTPSDDGSGGSGSGGSSGGGAGPAPDVKPPVIKLSGLPAKKVKRKSLLRGLKPRLSADEPVSFEVTLLSSAKKVSLARAYDLTLARAALPLGSGARSLKLKPRRRVVGRTRRFVVRVAVTAVDAAGNRSVVTRTLRVR